MHSNNIRVGAAAFAALLLTASCASGDKSSAKLSKEDSVARGEYLVRIGACNDCHTPGYLMSEGSTPVKDWLVGDSLGWSGPWGTTYAPNLRLRFQDFKDAGEWISYAHAMRPMPPMAWFNISAMTDEDLTAIYDFIRDLGPEGNPSPDYVPMGKTPEGPVVQFPMPPEPAVPAAN